jgi:hypothetical protein
MLLHFNEVLQTFIESLHKKKYVLKFKKIKTILIFL